jgi:hypothetical protein
LELEIKKKSQSAIKASHAQSRHMSIHEGSGALTHRTFGKLWQVVRGDYGIILIQDDRQ